MLQEAGVDLSGKTVLNAKEMDEVNKVREKNIEEVADGIIQTLAQNVLQGPLTTEKHHERKIKTRAVLGMALGLNRQIMEFQNPYWTVRTTGVPILATQIGGLTRQRPR